MQTSYNYDDDASIHSVTQLYVSMHCLIRDCLFNDSEDKMTASEVVPLATVMIQFFPIWDGGIGIKNKASMATPIFSPRSE